MLTTSAGIRCPDLAWLPPDRLEELLSNDPLVDVPPLVVEVLSPGNRRAEMAHKIRGYLESGASEVIVVAPNGSLTFYRVEGPHPGSALGVKLDLPARLFAG